MRALVDGLKNRAGLLPMWGVWFVALAAIVIVGLADLATGRELSLSIFYLVPVALVAWRSQLPTALLASGVAAAVWLMADLARSSGYSHSAIPFWNAAVRLAFFAIVSALLVRVRTALASERAHATVDQVTGIANGRSFRAALEREVTRARRYGRPMTVGYVDLDDFKAVNDTFGHHAGDELLRAVAGALRSNLRATDLVARVGGDEFAVLLPESGRGSAEAAMAKILRALPNVTRPDAVAVRASIGMLVCEEAPASGDEVLRQADSLMYRAKALGKGRVVYETFEPAEPDVSPLGRG